MLLDESDYRQFTPEECALLKEGAEAIVAFIHDLEDPFEVDVPEFDSMEPDEKLVALHTLCMRAASEETPRSRELWLDATLMAVLTMLESLVEMTFVNEGDDFGAEDRRHLSKLIVDSYRSFHWRPEEAGNVSLDEGSIVEEAMLAIDRGKSHVEEASEDLLAAILREYQTSWFYDFDFQSSGALDMNPEAYEELIANLGIAAEYHRETAPSCSPEAVRDAQKFFSV